MTTLDTVHSSTGDLPHSSRSGQLNGVPDSSDVAQFEALMAPSVTDEDSPDSAPAEATNSIDQTNAEEWDDFYEQFKKSVVNSTLQSMMQNQEKIKDSIDDLG